MNGSNIIINNINKHESGFTYIAALMTVIVMGIALGGASRYWHIVMKRDKEAELLFRGNQIRQAIGSYVKAGSGYPRRMEDLLKDPRVLTIRRHLRKIYKDPMTLSGQWEIILGPGGIIQGVFSKSQEKPLKQGNFPPGYEKFESARTYSDWKFAYLPASSKNKKP